MSTRKVVFKKCEFPEISNKKNNEFYDNDYDKILETENDDTSIRVIMTPFGVIPIINDQIMKSYIGNTNFNFTIQRETNDTQCDLELVENIEGVEIVKVFSRYKFLITIGELFDDEDVLNKVKKILCNTKESELEIFHSLVEKTKQNAKKHNYWAVYCLPNGQIETLISNEYNDNFIQQFSLLSKTYKGVGGLFFSYLNEDSN